MSEILEPIDSQTKQCNVCCLRMDNLSVFIERKEILRDINLHIHCGELLALLGPNGAGKTTLIKTIIGEIPFCGNLNFENIHTKNKRLTIGYTPQKLALEKNSPITVLDLFLTKISKKPICFFRSNLNKKKIEEILSIVKAEHLVNSKLGNLSGGELQRILLAYALHPTPNILLLDEPIAGIDQDGIQMFYALVSELRRRFDLSIIVITHDAQSIAPFADRFIFLNKVIQYKGDYDGLNKFIKEKNGEDICGH